MARKRLIFDANFPYHVTARSNNKDWFSLPMQLSWEIFEETLEKTAAAYSIQIHAFVLMSNHFHLLLSTPEKNLDKAMRYFLTETSRRMARASGRINHVFGARYKWSWLPGNYEIAYVYKYILRNPVRARICDSVESYPFSTFTKLLGKKTAIPVCESVDWALIPRPTVERILWLNRPLPKEQEELVRLALRRAKFAFSKSKKTMLRVRKLDSTYLWRV